MSAHRCTTSTVAGPMNDFIARHGHSPSWMVTFACCAKCYESESDARAVLTEDGKLSRNTPKCWERAL